MKQVEQFEAELANQTEKKGEISGPVKLQIEGLRQIYTEVLLIDMKPDNRINEPLIVFFILEQSQKVVNMIGHRLIHIKRMDLKNC